MSREIGGEERGVEAGRRAKIVYLAVVLAVVAACALLAVRYQHDDGGRVPAVTVRPASPPDPVPAATAQHGVHFIPVAPPDRAPPSRADPFKAPGKTAPLKPPSGG
jgi:hypothetical protein